MQNVVLQQKLRFTKFLANGINKHKNIKHKTYNPGLNYSLHKMNLYFTKVFLKEAFHLYIKYMTQFTSILFINAFKGCYYLLNRSYSCVELGETLIKIF